MGGKSSAPAAPDYSQVAAADAHAADLQYSLGSQQLAFGQQQYADTAPYVKQFLQQQTTSSAAQTQAASEAQSYYDTTYKPIETQFANEAQNYNTPANASQKAGGAMADVASQFDSARAASLSSLESYGIDPSQTRYGAIDLGTRITQAAATSAAGTQSRLNTEATGLALQGEAINTGRGYASNIAQAYNTATNAGSSGINSANQTTNTAVNAMGNPNSYFSGGNQAMANQSNAMNGGYSAQMQGYAANVSQSNATSQGIGTAVGAAAMAAMMFT